MLRICEYISCLILVLWNLSACAKQAALRIVSGISTTITRRNTIKFFFTDKVLWNYNRK